MLRDDSVSEEKTGKAEEVSAPSAEEVLLSPQKQKAYESERKSAQKNERVRNVFARAAKYTSSLGGAGLALSGVGLGVKVATGNEAVATASAYTAVVSLALMALSWPLAGVANIMSQDLIGGITDYTNSREKFFEKLEDKYSESSEIDIQDRAILATLQDYEIGLLSPQLQSAAFMEQRNIGLAAIIEAGKPIPDNTDLTLTLNVQNEGFGALSQKLKSERDAVLSVRVARKAVQAHQNYTRDALWDDLDDYNARRWHDVDQKDFDKLTQSDKDFIESTPYYLEQNPEGVQAQQESLETSGRIAATGIIVDHASPNGNMAARGAAAGAGLAGMAVGGIIMISAYLYSVTNAADSLNLKQSSHMHDADKAKVDLRANQETSQNAQNVVEKAKNEAGIRPVQKLKM